ncbi:MAG: response regulator transcription factor [Betaproteobacteria bacterium]|nr:response regulator transcription factor [Betaproteobacteria bacterium]
MRVAVLENDTRAAQVLEAWLQAAGFQIKLFTSGPTFSHEVNRASFDVALLGTLPAGTRCAEICETLRAKMSGVPLLRVLQKGSEQDIVAALKAGADDCMAVAREAELLARLEALLRRTRHAAKPAGELLEFGNLQVDFRNRLILRDGTRMMLTPKTYNLAVFLLSNSGQLLSRSYLLEQIWGHEKNATTRTLDTHVSRLRTLLGLTPEFGWQLQSVYQHGYRLDRLETVQGGVRTSQPALSMAA